MKKFIEAL